MLYLHNIFNGIWMMGSDYAANYLPLIASYIQGEPKNLNRAEHIAIPSISFASFQDEKYSISQNGSTSIPEDVPENSIAVLTIRGAITKHNQNCGPVGMLTQANLLDRCYSNDNIKAVVIVTESGGGEAYAMRILNEAIAKRNKAVIAFVDDLAASAAYGIISGCDLIVANSELARVGSIGTYQTIADHTEYFKKQGINIIDIYATESKDKNNDFNEALKGNLEPLRKTIDVVNKSFLSQIEKNRGDKLNAKQDVWGTGKVFFADEALSIGLIDRIDTFENVLNYF